jgi:hypothetical protein
VVRADWDREYGGCCIAIAWGATAGREESNSSMGLGGIEPTLPDRSVVFVGPRSSSSSRMLRGSV